MATLSELIKQRDSLPSGVVYPKIINGNEYFYHYYYENGKRKYVLLKKEEALKVKELIDKRALIQSEINKLLAKSTNITLSKKALSLTGYVMSGNIKVAEFDRGVLININNELAPLVIKRTHSLEKFLQLRTIDMSRTNARLLKKALNITTNEDYELSLYNYALTVSDDYWFKPKHSKLKYNNIHLNDDSCYETSLKGDTTFFPCKPRLSPELTTTGSFEKGWKLIDNHWWLYKVGNNKQLFSEMFCYEFAKLIGVNTATYELEDKYIRSKNFAEEYNYEPIASLADSNDNYDYIFDILYKIDKKIAKDYLKLMYFDAVVFNVDRHNENLGLLRDRLTGGIVALAPNFDNNLALISNVDKLRYAKDDSFIKLFIKFLKENNHAYQLFKSISFKEITVSDVKEIINRINTDIENKEDLANKIIDRYNYIKRVL